MSITSFIFFLSDIPFASSSKKQSIATLSTCEAEYISATSCSCHAICLRRRVKEIKMKQPNFTTILIGTKSELVLTKNLVFHDCSKHYDTKYHFLENSWSKKR
ncbi:Retrovirus-related Pol polyprotein from transposon TNT 1-94 [Linum grandiflorum]